MGKDRVKINVAGTYFEFDRILLQDKKCERLAELCCRLGSTEKPHEITIDRSALCFGAILSYYQTGEMHIPPGVCLGAFSREMEFWQVESDALYECCLYRYQAFLDDEATRRNFLRKALLPKSVVSPTIHPEVHDKITKYRSRMWKIVDNNEHTVAAKLYFILVFLMVLLSIFVLALSTEPSMRRRVSKCELLEYMKHTGHKHYDKVYEILGSPDCLHTGSWLAGGDLDYEDFDLDAYNWNYYEFTWGTIWGNVADILPGNFENSNENQKNSNDTSSSEPKPTSGKSSWNESLDLTTMNVSATFDDSVYDLASLLRSRPREKPVRKTVDIPDLTVPKLPFAILDIIINAFFTIDLVLRLVTCPSVRCYFLSIINIFDALALLACYIFVIIVSVHKEYFYKESAWVNLLEFAQVFRVMRLFRVVKNVRASRVLAYSLTQNVRDMTLLITLLFVGISTFACLFYYAESPKTIESIPNAWYWAIITMTTVGYGDISPQTRVGRVISSICAICGVLLLAVALPMFVNNFLTLYQYSCVTESIQKRRGKKGVVTFRSAEIAILQNGAVIVHKTICDEAPEHEVSKKNANDYSENANERTVKEAFVS